MIRRNLMVNVAADCESVMHAHKTLAMGKFFATFGIISNAETQKLHENGWGDGHQLNAKSSIEYTRQRTMQTNIAFLERS
jgi:hypothetical protein